MDRAEREGRMNWITIIYLDNLQTMVCQTKFDHTTDDNPENEWSDAYKAEHYQIIKGLEKYNKLQYLSKMVSVPATQRIDLYFI